MNKPETLSFSERLEGYREASVLIPLVIQYLTAFEENQQFFDNWGEDAARVAEVLAALGHNPGNWLQVRTLVLSGKNEVDWEGGQNVLAPAVGALDRGAANVSVGHESWKTYWTALALRATVMEISDLNPDRFINNLGLIELVRQDRTMFMEVWGQLLPGGDAGQADRAYQFFSGLNLALEKPSQA